MLFLSKIVFPSHSKYTAWKLGPHRSCSEFEIVLSSFGVLS